MIMTTRWQQKGSENMKRLGIRIPDNLHKKIKEEASYQGYTMSAYIKNALWQYVENEKIKQNGGKTNERILQNKTESN